MKLCKRDRNRQLDTKEIKKETYKTVNNDKAESRKGNDSGAGRREYDDKNKGKKRKESKENKVRRRMGSSSTAVTTKCRLSNMEIMPSANIIGKLLEQTMAARTTVGEWRMDGCGPVRSQ